MDLVQILLLCAVGFSVLVFLFINFLDSVEEGRKNSDDVEQRSSLVCDSESKIEYVEETDDREEEKGGGDKLAESGTVESVDIREIEEHTEAVSGKSNLCSGILGMKGNNKGEILNSNMEINEEDDKDAEEDFDDWEGIERTDLEKDFGKAVVFVSYNSNADRIIEDMKLQLHGLQRIALEGVCYGSQPMALKVSARAKWNAWRKLGNMRRETAMEKYIDILSEHIPEWKVDGTYMCKSRGTSEDDHRSSQPNKHQV